MDKIDFVLVKYSILLRDILDSMRSLGNNTHKPEASRSPSSNMTLTMWSGQAPITLTSGIHHPRHLLPKRRSTYQRQIWSNVYLRLWGRRNAGWSFFACVPVNGVDKKKLTPWSADDLDNSKVAVNFEKWIWKINPFANCLTNDSLKHYESWQTSWQYLNPIRRADKWLSQTSG